MTDVDKQIEQARRKPSTAENLNYIGDLYLKKGDTQRAMLFFYEAADKLHFAQKDKKIAIYKKIINIAPSAEKAYLEIIELLSQLGLAMEEKKYLHLLGTMYEQNGEFDKAEQLMKKVSERDPHVSMPGSFFHEPLQSEEGSRETAEAEEIPPLEEKGIADELSVQMDEQTPPLEEHDEEPPKLIEASIEEFVQEERLPPVARKRIPPDKAISKMPFPLINLLVAAAVLVLAIAVILFFITGRSRQKAIPELSSTVSSAQGDFLVSLKKIDDLKELEGIIHAGEMQQRAFAEVSIKAVKGCLPDAFASSPHTMISLLDAQGSTVAARVPEGLRFPVRVIYRTGVCTRERGVVYVRFVLPMEKDRRYSGLSIRGLQPEGAPVVLKWGKK